MFADHVLLLLLLVLLVRLLTPLAACEGCVPLCCMCCAVCWIMRCYWCRWCCCWHPWMHVLCCVLEQPGTSAGCVHAESKLPLDALCSC
jgi:hypothetical protein